MEIKIERVQCDPDVTIGSMSVDGDWEAWTCEDVVRPAGAGKVPGNTAIPAGTYQVIVTYSPHFKQDLPLLVNVPNFEGVRIHSGNTPADTEGCLLVGHDRYSKSIGHSRFAFAALFTKITDAVRRGEKISLEIA
jgi:hypothetical protein